MPLLTSLFCFLPKSQNEHCCCRTFKSRETWLARNNRDGKCPVCRRGGEGAAEMQTTIPSFEFLGSPRRSLPQLPVRKGLLLLLCGLARARRKLRRTVDCGKVNALLPLLILAQS